MKPDAGAVVDRLRVLRWYKDADHVMRTIESITASPSGNRTKWSIGQLNYSIQQLDELIALAPEGTKPQVLAYRARLRDCKV